jgi:sulfite reductase beta subunit-like hemoprotein
VGADSGLSVETVFDVYPYAHALNRALQGFDKAYALPRKFKVAFFGSERDLLRAAIHDLGYVAQIKGEEKGFRVFAGGGMGRESATGLCLIDFLPAKQLLQATFALISLFYDHGNRENRQQARLRFLVHRIGREAFLRLFLHYYVMTDVPKLSLRIPDTALPPDFILNAGKRVSPQMGDDPPYRRWKEIAVLPTRFHTAVKSVRLFVPYGNLAAAQLREIVKQVQRTGSPFVRLLITQDILIPFVSETLLPRLYANLKQALPGLDLTFASYRGHIVTCVGSTVCKIGMVDSPSVADCLAERLDRFLPADTPEKLALLRLAADDLRISGCPNACSGHPAARIGMGCINQKVNGMIQPYGRLFLGAGVTDGAPRLSTADGEGKPEPVKALIEVVMKKMTALVGLKGEAACPAAIREQTVPWS